MLKITQSYYITTQLQLPLNLEVTFKLTDEIITFNNLVKDVDFNKYFQKKSITDTETRGRKKKARANILKVILFAFSIHVRSTRDIADLCKHDTRFMYLLNGEEAPSHTTINQVINSIKDNIDDILVDINNQIQTNETNINTDIMYVDGTKIEAYANKYSFVWKKSILKFQNRLFIKITNALSKINTLFSENYIDPIPVKERYTAKELAEIVAQLNTIIERNGICCVYGKGKHKEEAQRLFDMFEEFFDKMLTYETHLSIIGNKRNSYSKIDHDATFMRMKEDHMRNGQLKAAYNVQIAVSDEYIMGIELYQDRTDFDTFIPFLNHLKKLYGKYPTKPLADAGYGCFNNYYFCSQNNIELYQKYTMYSKEKENKYRKNPFNKRNFKKDQDENYICPNNKKLVFERQTETKYKHSTAIEKIYRCYDCEGCPLRKDCTTSKYGRSITINEDYEQMKQIVRENLESEEGIKLRVNRSIQVEGTFGVIKEDMKYKRFNRRKMANARLEITLVAIGLNISKFHNKKYRIVQ